MSLDAGIESDAVRKLAQYIASPRFQDDFEKFFLRHSLSFHDDEEHELAYMEIYKRFQELFNEHMEEFLKEEGLDEEDFGKLCEEAVKEDSESSKFVDVVLASMDYKAFYDLMRVVQGRAIAESKDAKQAGDEHEDKGESKDNGESKAEGKESK